MLDKSADMKPGWRDFWHMTLHVGALARENPEITSFMLHRARATKLAPGGIRIVWTPLDEISTAMVCAIVNGEDPDYFQHRGVDWRRLRAAVWAGLRGKGWRGASTITQQLARNIYLYPERSLSRKAREAVLALMLEQKLSKARILELYLNVIEWGDGIWGIGAAAQHYLRRRPSEIGAVGAAALTSLLPAPRRPLRDANADRAFRSQNWIIWSLYICGVLSMPQAAEAQARLRLLSDALRAERRWSDTLQRMDTPLEWASSEHPSLTVNELLALQCGRAAMEHYRQCLRRHRRANVAAVRWPTWWSATSIV